MRLTIEQAQLLKSLQAVERAVNERSTLPILANILLEAKQHELVVTGTDLDVGVQCRAPLMEQPEEGAVTLPARRLSLIVRELPPEPIMIEAKKNHTATLACGASRFRIPGLPPEDFPTFPTQEQTQPSTIAHGALKTLVNSTGFSMSLEETRFILNGALLKASQGSLTMVATDGRRLAVATAPLASGGQQEQVLGVIPAKTVRELGRLLGFGQEQEERLVTITPLKDNQLLFQFDEVTMMTRLIDGQFPPYEGVIPAPTATTLTCSRTLLASAVKRASLMTTATSQAIVFELAKDRLVISKESAEFGSAREEVPATYTGEPMTIAFNPEFWLDPLKVMEPEELTIEFSTQEKPAVIRLPAPTAVGAQAGRPSALYLILPMKLA